MQRGPAAGLKYPVETESDTWSLRQTDGEAGSRTRNYVEGEWLERILPSLTPRGFHTRCWRLALSMNQCFVTTGGIKVHPVQVLKLECVTVAIYAVASVPCSNHMERSSNAAVQ